jgi:hypothetical protein
MFIALCGNAQDTVRTFILGDTLVQLVAHRSEKPGPLYFNMHDDENTCVEAAAIVVERYGGTLYELIHTGERNITFHIDSMRYEIDPNRMYSDAGVWREIRRVYVQDSLMRLEFFRVQDSVHMRMALDTFVANAPVMPPSEFGIYNLFVVLDSLVRVNGIFIHDTIFHHQFNARDSMVLDMIRAFADTLLSVLQIDSQRLVIALHNNKNDGYNLTSYFIDSLYEREALAVYHGFHPDPDEFYFVTTRRLFEALQPNPYHIVLQDNSRMTDDGSLSVYCGLHGIGYVNVEAQHRHAPDQRKMLEILLERIGGTAVMKQRFKKQ